MSEDKTRFYKEFKKRLKAIDSLLNAPDSNLQTGVKRLSKRARYLAKQLHRDDEEYMGDRLYMVLQNLGLIEEELSAIISPEEHLLDKSENIVSGVARRIYMRYKAGKIDRNKALSEFGALIDKVDLFSSAKVGLE